MATAASLLTGWIDSRAGSPEHGAKVERSDADWIVVSSDWISARVSAKAGDAVATDDTVLLLLGRPLWGERPISAEDLAAMFARTADAVEKLGGRYAVVHGDRRTGSVQLVTDRFSVWPLCWSHNGSRLAFSDRADSVPIDGPRHLDPQALYNYVYFHFIPTPQTAFRGVQRLEPATRLWFDGSTIDIRSTWRPHFTGRRVGPIDELANQFRDAIGNSVISEAADFSVGCFLSGGTDSSTVVGTLKQLTGRARTFSIGFDQPGYDEMSYARIAARHFGTEHTEHYVDPAQLIDAIPRVATAYDQPFGNSSAVPAYICARLAHDGGVTKLLAGDGGVELFGGNSRYAKQKLFEAWSLLPGPMRRALSPLVVNPFAKALPVIRKAASYMEQANIPLPGRLETYNLLQHFGPRSVFTDAFLEMADPEAPQSLQRAVYSRQQRAAFIDRMLAYDWRFTLADNDLPKVVGTARLAGIAVGFPLLSDALVDLSLQLGPSDKVRGLRLRHFFKESLTGFLPPEVIAKKKHGFGLPVGLWLVNDAPFRALARAAVNELVHVGMLRTAFVEELFDRRLQEHPGYYGEMVWVLMMMALWLKAHHAEWKLG
jgi:asparagine synthase (glutamine-hydrolysing)